MALNVKLYETSILFDILENKIEVVKSDTRIINRLTSEIESIKTELKKRGAEIPTTSENDTKALPLQNVMPCISHFEDALKNRHHITDAKCLIDHRGVLIFYAEKRHPGEKTNMILKPIYKA